MLLHKLGVTNIYFLKQELEQKKEKEKINIRVIENWNNLPSTVVEAPTLNSFKSILNKYWVYPYKFNARCYMPY